MFLGWIFALFGGSNNTQISMFGVKWLRDLTTRGAWLLWGQAPLVVGFLNHFAQNFRFWGTFRPKQGARSASRIISRTTESILVTKNKSDYSWCPKCTQKGGGTYFGLSPKTSLPLGHWHWGRGPIILLQWVYLLENYFLAMFVVKCLNLLPPRSEIYVARFSSNRESIGGGGNYSGLRFSCWSWK